MKRRLIRLGATLALCAVAALGQSTASTSFSNPANIVWGIVAVLGAMASGFFALSLIWTSIQGAVSDHDAFHKLPKIVFWAAICFSATYLAGRFALGG